ncbi:glycine-rich protein 5 isoform X2 [Eurytemora carolleeae]|uniref:glycine-rich protein 5 isoform X2 n=1 Tax=Eurytemora carolleeae TaxID=1294199 RepID=UPI000C79484D|nr:glycine-rich protein 5 isoform X2 [Eurytemora carolleeae]|eukprot:XP_023340282.1 glycine-rich protein 5-like isoform X2 [Eurytemora affinis]
MKMNSFVILMLIVLQGASCLNSSSLYNLGILRERRDLISDLSHAIHTIQHGLLGGNKSPGKLGKGLGGHGSALGGRGGALGGHGGRLGGHGGSLDGHGGSLDGHGGGLDGHGGGLDGHGGGLDGHGGALNGHGGGLGGHGGGLGGHGGGLGGHGGSLGGQEGLGLGGPLLRVRNRSRGPLIPVEGSLGGPVDNPLGGAFEYYDYDGPVFGGPRFRGRRSDMNMSRRSIKKGLKNIG